jgi:lipid A 3-O-deacylase
MRRTFSLAGLAIGAAIVAPTPAAALDEIKVGVLAHNICVANCKNADKEDGPIVDVQLNFGSPDFLRVVGSPKPYVAISPNVSGDTSFAAAGLEWRWEFVDGWALTPSFGIAAHDGETDNPFANGTPQSTQFNQDHILHGSRALFRSAIGIQRELGEHWRVEATVLHYSHGQILGKGRNQGTDQAGVRIGYKFAS